MLSACRRETRRLGGAAGALAALEPRRARGPPRDEPRDAGRRFGSDERRRFAFRRGGFCFRKRAGFGRILVRAHRRRATAMGLTGIVGDDVAGSPAAARTHADALAATASLRGVLALGAPGAAAIATQRRGHAPRPSTAGRPIAGASRTPGSGPPWSACFQSDAPPERASAETLALAVDTTRGAGAPRASPSATREPARRAARSRDRLERRRGDAPPRGHAHAALGDDDGEPSAASAAAAAAAARPAAQTLDAARGDGGGGGIRRRRPRRRRPRRGGSAAAATACGALLCDTDLRGRHHPALVCARAWRTARASPSAELRGELRARPRLGGGVAPVAALARFGGADVVAADLAVARWSPCDVRACAGAGWGAAQVTTNEDHHKRGPDRFRRTRWITRASRLWAAARLWTRGARRLRRSPPPPARRGRTRAPDDRARRLLLARRVVASMRPQPSRRRMTLARGACSPHGVAGRARHARHAAEPWPSRRAPRRRP